MEERKNIKHCIEKSYVFLDLNSKTKEEAISEMLIRAEEKGLRININTILEKIYKKEKIMTSGLGYGVAFPHTPTDEVEQETLIFGISKEGIDYSSLDKKPVHLLIMILNPESDTEIYLSHLSIFTKISRLTMYIVLLIESKTEQEFKTTILDVITALEEK